MTSNEYIEALIKSCDEQLTDLTDTEQAYLSNKLHIMAEIYLQRNPVQRFSLEVTHQGNSWKVAFVAWLPYAKILVEGSCEGQCAQRPKEALRWLLSACQRWEEEFVERMMEDGYEVREAEVLRRYFD